MSKPITPAACVVLDTLIDRLGEDAPDAVVTHTILDHVACCPTCCQAEAVLTRLLADYRFAGTAMPARLERRLLDHVCSQFGTPECPPH